jgi:P27 family predicted phage terminase small subunit
MTEKDLTRLKKDIVTLLKEKKLYEKTDLTLLEELVYQFQLMIIAKSDIQLRGIQVNVREYGEPLMQLNQSVSVVQKCTRTIQSLYRQLSIAPQDRARLKMNVEDDPQNDFDKFMNQE